MGSVKRHTPVKLIIGCIFKEAAAYQRAKSILEKRFGPVDFESAILDFTHTDYYEREFGSRLKRSFISFKKLIAPDALAAIKNATNRIEKKLSKNNLRRVNLDPGYLTLSKFILATTKDYTHRIYLGKGIYAEVTLFYKDKGFKTWEWTYPDYRSNAYIEIFNRIRALYAGQIKNATTVP
jgi:hypothetical protein